MSISFFLISFITVPFWFWGAIKVWKLESGGRRIVMIMAIVSFFLEIPQLLFGGGFLLSFPYVIIIGLAFILCLLPGTKAAFHQPDGE
jgi:hypothetical protein